MKRKWWTTALAVALTVGIGYGGYSVWWNHRTVAQASAGETATVERRTLRLTVEGNGTLVPPAEASLAFRAGGPVADVFVSEGERVQAGEALVRLECDDLELQVAQAEAALASAEAHLAQLVATPRPEEVAAQEANLGAAQAQVSAAAATRDRVAAGADAGQIAAAEAQVASVTTRRKQAYDWHETTMECIDIDRTFTLPDGSRKHIEKTVCPLLGPMEEKARYNWQAAEASLAAAQAQLAELKAGADRNEIRAAEANVAAAVAQRDAARARLDQLLASPTTEEVKAQQAAVDEAQAALNEAHVALDEATLTAPFAGTVTHLEVESGELVGSNRPIVELSDLSKLEVDLSLDEADAARVSVGRQALITLDAFPDAELAGEVTHVAPVGETVSGVVLYPVTLALHPSGTSAGSGLERAESPEPAPPVRAGMTANVAITIESRENASVVPLRAVHTGGEQAYVDRLTDGQAERVDVTLGTMTDTHVEIESGLSEGDVVIIVPKPTEDQRRGPLNLFGG